LNFLDDDLLFLDHDFLFLDDDFLFLEDDHSSHEDEYPFQGKKTLNSNYCKYYPTDDYFFDE